MINFRCLSNPLQTTMQSPWTNIGCSSMGLTKELSDFKCGRPKIAKLIICSKPYKIKRHRCTLPWLQFKCKNTKNSAANADLFNINYMTAIYMKMWGSRCTFCLRIYGWSAESKWGSHSFIHTIPKIQHWSAPPNNIKFHYLVFW